MAILEEEAGLPTSKYSGLAMGLGLDCRLMLVKQLDDIRTPRPSRRRTRLAGRWLVSEWASRPAGPPRVRDTSCTSCRCRRDRDRCDRWSCSLLELGRARPGSYDASPLRDTVTLVGQLFDEGTLAQAGMALERAFKVAAERPTGLEAFHATAP